MHNNDKTKGLNMLQNITAEWTPPVLEAAYTKIPYNLDLWAVSGHIFWPFFNPIELLPWPHVHLSGLDGVEDELRDALALHVDEVRLEERLRGLEPLAAHLDDAAVGQGVRLHEERRLLQRSVF